MCTNKSTEDFATLAVIRTLDGQFRLATYFSPCGFGKSRAGVADAPASSGAQARVTGGRRFRSSIFMAETRTRVQQPAASRLHGYFVYHGFSTSPRPRPCQRSNNTPRRRPNACDRACPQYHSSARDARLAFVGHLRNSQPDELRFCAKSGTPGSSHAFDCLCLWRDIRLRLGLGKLQSGSVCTKRGRKYVLTRCHQSKCQARGRGSVRYHGQTQAHSCVHCSFRRGLRHLRKQHQHVDVDRRHGDAGARGMRHHHALSDHHL